MNEEMNPKQNDEMDDGSLAFLHILVVYSP